jgi:drug/metabolite transporter (DMT)-like permease
VSLYAYINPVIAVVLGTLLLGEPFGWRVMIAATVVFTGVAVVRFAGTSRTAAQAGKARAAA